MKSALKSAYSTTTKDSTDPSRKEIKVTFESLLNLKELEEIYEGLQAEGDGYSEKLKLTKEQLSEFLSYVVQKGTEEQHNDFFDKVDATKDGRIDWENISTHLLMEFYGKDDRNKLTMIPQWKDIKFLPTPHRDVIQRVAYAEKLKKYVTISREGVLVLWDDATCRQYKSGRLSSETVKQRDLWITDFALMNSIGKFAVAYTSKEICIYDLNTKLNFVCQFRLQGFATAPFCLHFWQNPVKVDKAILTVGFTGGSLMALNFEQANITLFERPTMSANEDKEQTFVINVNNIKANPPTEAAKASCHCWLAYHSQHNEWVREVKYIPSLDCFLSCSTSNTSSMILAWRSVGKMKISDPIKAMGGVNSFDFHEELNQIAVGCGDRNVYLYNPFVISKPVAMLRGHMSSVIQVQFNCSRGQLLSFCKDKVLRVWNVAQQICLQRLAGMFPRGVDVISRLFFHEERSYLLLSFDYRLTVMEMRPEVTNRITSHEKPVTVAACNSFNQVISCDTLGNAFVWMLDTGQKAKNFLSCHDGIEISCMTQNIDGTRFYTGSPDGIIKEWDLNGVNRRQFFVAGGISSSKPSNKSESKFSRANFQSRNINDKAKPADIQQLLFLKRHICAVGWEKTMCLFKTADDGDSFRPKKEDFRSTEMHSEDVMAIAFVKPITLATGSIDGEIMIWNLNSENCIGVLDERKRPPAETDESINESRPTSKHSNKIGIVDEVDTYSITRMCFIESRMENKIQIASGVANLISCGSGGWVRFWNTIVKRNGNRKSQSQCCNPLKAEFCAHPEVASIIMYLEPRENVYLVTGDTDGFLKVWTISDYARHTDDITHKEPPELYSQMQLHEDVITSIDMVKRNEIWLLCTASADCTVKLSGIEGFVIGIFGQEELWKIQRPPPEEEIIEDEASEEEAQPSPEVIAPEEELPEELKVKAVDKHIRQDSEHEAEKRYDIWKASRLGTGYSENRVSKRQRRQPTKIVNLPYLFGEMIGKPSFGPHYSLETKDLFDVERVKVTKPSSIYDMRLLMKEDTNLAPVWENLDISKAPIEVIDERSLFTKEILEREAMMKARQLEDLLNDAKQRQGSDSIVPMKSKRRASVMKPGHFNRGGGTHPINL